MQLSLPAGQKFVLTMSDATGFGAGGSTELLTVQPSLGTSCNTTGGGEFWSYMCSWLRDLVCA